MENLVVFAKKKLTLDKFLSQVKIESNDEIKRVLSVTAKAGGTVCDFSGTQVSCTGKVVVSAVFVTVDGEIKETNSVLDFAEKQQTSVALVDTVCNDDLNVEIVNNSSNEIMCSVTHNIEIIGNYKYEIPVFDANQTDLVLNKKTENILNFVCACEDNFVVAEEFESNAHGMKILRADASVVLGSQSVLVDKVVVEGKVVLELVYCDDEGLGKLVKEFEFKQEIESQNALPNQQTFAMLSIKNTTITPEEKEDKLSLVCVFDLFAKAYVYEEGTVELVQDLFSLKNEIVQTKGYAEVKNYKKTVVLSDTVLCLTNVAELENFDDVKTVYAPKFEVLSIEDEGRKAVVNGKVKADALYEANGEILTLQVETETSIEIEKESNEKLAKFDACLSVSNHKVKAGKELETAIKIENTCYLETELTLEYVAGFENASEKLVENGGIKVYVTKQGETLFEIAKILNVKPEIIAAQNEVDGVFEQGEKIYVYSQANLL